LCSLFKQLEADGLVEVQRLEALNPVAEAITMGIIDDDDDQKTDYEDAMLGVAAFSTKG
jgi:hypothetical protein